MALELFVDRQHVDLQLVADAGLGDLQNSHWSLVEHGDEHVTIFDVAVAVLFRVLGDLEQPSHLGARTIEALDTNTIQHSVTVRPHRARPDRDGSHRREE